jgi:replication factor C subunit 3/5
MSIPWVELWRPTKIMNIILDPINKEIMNNIIETGYFPNLLIYGPPGVGKTSSVIALVNEYQAKHNYKTNGLIIQNNASEDRGVDIIRNQIAQFVNSKTLFNEGMKFIILDEADYMTKNAQQALRYLLQEYSSSVRFCLICNYISRIDDGLQNEFLKLRFNQLPEKDIHNFLMNIALKENLNISENIIISIQKLYKSDIRSMINYMQTNQDVFNKEFKIINNELLENIFLKIKEKIKIKEMLNYIRKVSIDYNIDHKNIIKYLINYIIRNKKVYIQSELLNFIEDIMHNQNCNIAHYTGYVFTKLSDLINKID